MSKSIVLWEGPKTSIIPKGSTNSPGKILKHATQLGQKDVKQIITSFNSDNFEMVSGFIWSKAMGALKRQLAALGMSLVSEMLGRPDIDEDSPPSVVSDYEALTLARDLGMISSTDTVRLKQSLELVSHFAELDPQDSDEVEMTQTEALSCIYICVESILGRPKIEVAFEFANFRRALEERTFKDDDTDIINLKGSPAFFKRTAIRILMSNIKSVEGAQLEHTIGNCNIIIPSVWKDLKAPEKMEIGLVYAELISRGRNTAAIGLKKALLKVKGFDFVPESLRSSTFISAASNIINVHQSNNNFYNEPAAISALSKLGTIIPMPAFRKCMTAILCVRLGNSYGRSWSAQPDAITMLNNLSNNQWEFYLNECLIDDAIILEKLAWSDLPKTRWVELINDYKIYDLPIKVKLIQSLIDKAKQNDFPGIKSYAERLRIQIGGINSH